MPVIRRVAEQVLLAGTGSVIPQLIGTSGRVASGGRAGSSAGPRSIALLLWHGRAHRLILLSISRLLVKNLRSARRLRLVLIALLVEALLSLPHVRILGLLHLNWLFDGHLSLSFASLPFLVLFPHKVHVFELLMNVFNLLVAQAECFPIDQAANRMELVHDHKVLLVVVIVDGADILLEQRVVKLVVPTLLQLQIQDAAANLEEVLYNILALTAILA